MITEHHLLLFLFQLGLIVGISRVLSIFFERWKFPSLSAEILTGVLLGPTILGRLLPGVQSAIFPNDPVQHTMLGTLGWIGVMLLLLVTGLEVNFKAIWSQRQRVAKLTIADVFLPLLIAGIFIFFLPESFFQANKVVGTINLDQRLLSTVFLAAIMAISALPVAIRVMHEFNLLKTDMGLLAVSALSIHDIIGWMFFTIVLGIFSQGRADIGFIVTTALSTIAFTLVAFTVGRNLVDRLLSYFHRLNGDNNISALTIVVVLGILCGALTLLIGIHSLFGFFIAGLVCGESKKLSEHHRQTLGQFAFAVFVPVFFVKIGLDLDIVAHFNLYMVVFMTLVGMAARFLAAWAGAFWGGIAARERLAIGILNTPGGAMHVVIATLALSAGLISQELFVAIVFAALLSSVLLGPLLTLVLPRNVRSIKVTVYTHPDAVYLGASSKQAVLERLAFFAAVRTGLPAANILEPILQREDLLSTSWKRGIAVPHARLDGLKEAIVIFGRSQTGIDWDSSDGLPVNLLFLVLTPPGDDAVHLGILKALALELQKKGFREQLMQADNLDVLHDHLDNFVIPGVNKKA